MNPLRRSRSAALALCILFTISSTGCARLKPSESSRYGYLGDAAVKEGKRIVPIDWLGNLFGAFPKLILWNWKVNRHHIHEETEQAIQAFLEKNHDTLGNVDVQLNRYAPQDAWKRLVHNKGVKWPYRLLMGSFTVLIVDTLLINRLFGFDYYNPFTHTVHLYSDVPSVALHELGHAKDFAERRHRGSYAALRLVPFADLYQEYQATEDAFEYIRSEHQMEREIEAFKILYPAYGTYMGSYLFVTGGSVAGAIGGHIYGRIEAHKLAKNLKS